MTSPAPLTGLAVGDALGMPFEMESPLSENLSNWTGEYRNSGRNAINHKLKPGQFTDDTQMSIALAEALLEKNYYDMSVAAKKYLAWFTSGDCRGIGTTTRIAMMNIAQGRDLDSCGVEGAEGNGTAMRAAPLGAHQTKGVERLRAAAFWGQMDASVTHRSTEAFEGSAAIAVATSHLCSGGRKDALLPTVLEHVRTSQVRVGIETLHRALRRGDTMEDFLKTREWLLSGVSGHVVQTVPAAFTIFAYSDNFSETVRNAVSLGGDTDTVAAIAGALAGSYYGIEGIPETLLLPLERAAYLRDLELRLLAS